MQFTEDSAHCQACQQNEDLIDPQEELRRSEHRYQILFETMLQGVVYQEASGRIISMNPAAERILGKTSEEFLGSSSVGEEHHTIREDGSPFPGMEHPAMVSLQTGKKLQNVIMGVYNPRMRCYRWISVDAVPIFRPGEDKPYQVYTLFDDITERKQADEAIRESEERYRSLFNSMAEGFALHEIICDEQGEPLDYRFLDINPAFERLTGLNRDVIGKTLNEVLPDEDPRWIKEYGAVALTGEPAQFDNYSSALGRHYEVFSYRPAPRQFAAIFMDITKRKQMEAALRESEQLYRAIGESIDYGVWVCAPDGRNIYASDSFLRLVGITQEQCSNFGWGDTLHHDDIERTIASWRECVRNEGTWDIEHRFLGVDGKWHDILARGVPVRNNRGEVTCWAGINLDISRMKLVEGELRKARDELELRVQERTAELLQAKEELECMNEELRIEIEAHRHAKDDLRLAKEAAEAAAKAKSDFMANMSHEIRTPMNAVIGMTSLLLDDSTLNPEQKDFIETIRMSGDALMVIINDILDFSKMQENKIILEDQPFELGCCIEEAIDLVARKASEKGLNLVYIIDKSVPEVIIGDPNRLRQILSNLLSNAVKFTEQGEIKLSVSAQRLNEVRFAVQDTGIGISQDQMDRLFQPFSQVDLKAKHNYGGTGLGLIISKKLVELMEGEIWAESQPGKGSTFCFTIKAETAPADPSENLIKDQPQLVGSHVLIVNDNRSNRRILGAYVYSWGMIPLVASRIQDALNWIRRGDAFDVAILDMDMQDMAGLKVDDEIRRYNKTLPLVMLTSVGKHLPSNHAYLIKPIKPSHLRRVLTNVISTGLTQKSERARAADKENKISSLRILLAEDNVTSQKVAIQILKRMGYKADVVANGIEVLQALERQPYDIVLMDVRMPEMNGLEATRIIRQRWPDNGPKVVAVTAYALHGDREKCIKAGMNDYISKPIRVDELAEVLSRYQTAERP